MGDISVFSADHPGEWYVLHTKSRQEKALASDLERLGVDAFLPLATQTRYYGKRKLTVEEALFPGYVFLRGSLDQAYSADRTRRVANVIRVADQNEINAELKSLSVALTLRVPLDPYPYLKNGVKVRVKAGPMQGMQGVVERRGEWNRLILQVNILGQAASLEIDGSLLEPVD